MRAANQTKKAASAPRIKEVVQDTFSVGGDKQSREGPGSEPGGGTEVARQVESAGGAPHPSAAAVPPGGTVGRKFFAGSNPPHAIDTEEEVRQIREGGRHVVAFYKARVPLMTAEGAAYPV